MRVQLDVFSGRPNPSWDLTPEEAAEFRRLFRTLPESGPVGAPPGGLGYRGIIVTETEDDVHGWDEIVVWKGLIWARRGDELRHFTDKDRSLERWLCGTRPKIPGT
jgi:hypothetical protein